jgi:nitrogenase molybdenum-iron protein alpha/beta subunit
MNQIIGAPLNLPFTTGVMLGVNGVVDAVLLVDGPGCVHAKARQIHGPHDIESTVLDVLGAHRIGDSHLDVHRVATSYEDQVVDRLVELGNRPGTGIVVLCDMPLGTIAGTDYRRLIAQASAHSAKPLCWLPGESLRADWLAGYAGLLDVLAESLELPSPDPRPGHVAIVGYFMDRNEGDHRGNVAALGHLLGGVDLELCSLWLSGGDSDSLRRVQEAEAIVSLPHGRAAAARLAARLDVPLVETGLPFGMAGTRRWLETVSHALGRGEQADLFIEQELERVIPLLEWVVPQAFLGRQAVFLGDPHYALPLAELLEEVGTGVSQMWLVGQEQTLTDESRAALAAEGRCVSFEPRSEDLLAQWRDRQDQGVDLLITNNVGLELLKPRGAWIEWGFPSHHTHFLLERPFLGFTGALAFLERMAQEIGRQGFH